MIASAFWELAVRDSPEKPFFVFHTDDHPAGTGVRLRPEYHRLACKACGWYDPRKAAGLGLHPEVRCPFRNRDVLTSDDGRYVVSRRARAALEKVTVGRVEFFDLPGDRDFYLAFCRKRIVAPKDLPVSKRSVNGWKRGIPFVKYDECECGHSKSVACHLEFLKLDPKIDLAAVIVDHAGWDGYSDSWIASDSVAKQLKLAKLAGLWLQRIVAADS